MVTAVDSSETFGRRIRSLRQERNLTQRELADRVAARLKGDEGRGFDVTYLSKIENDRLGAPSVPVVIQLAAILATNCDELLALAGRTPPDIGKTLVNSPGARAFFRSATDLALTEDDWAKLLQRIQRQKEKG